MGSSIHLAQKRLELEQFSRFGTICGCVPDCEVNQPDFPEPDVVLRCASGSIGLELTAVHPNGPVGRWQESEQVRLLEMAKKLYQDAGHEPLSIWVHWTKNPLLLKTRRERLAESFCELVASHCTPRWELCEIELSALRRYSELPLVHVAFAAASSWESADWRDGAFHQVEPVGVPEVQAMLISEDPKVERYKQDYASLWVVLLCEAAGPSSWGVTLNEVWRTTFRSEFDRAFLVELGHGKGGELKVG